MEPAELRLCEEEHTCRVVARNPVSPGADYPNAFNKNKII